MLDRRSPRDRDLLPRDSPAASATRGAHDGTVLSLHEATTALATDRTPALPAPSSALIGRDAEVERLLALLSDPAVRLVTLTGPGGIGKTRLALAVAEAMQHRLTDGAIFIDLSAVTRAADVVPAIAQALGLRERVGQDQRRQINDFLRPKDLLLVLDNVEQIIDAAPQIAQIAREATGTTVLVTSRAPLRVGGEQEIPVPPLLLLAGSDATPDELLASEAGRLFVERAQARDQSLVVDAATDPRHCGDCTTRCQVTATCDAGICTCAKGVCNFEGFSCCGIFGGPSLCTCVTNPGDFFDPITCTVVTSCLPVRQCVGSGNPVPPGCRACCPAGSTCDSDLGVCWQ